MALFLRQEDEQRTRLQDRVAAQLQERTQSSKQVKAEKPDPAFLDDQHTTKTGGVILVVAVIVVLGILFWLLRP